VSEDIASVAGRVRTGNDLNEVIENAMDNIIAEAERVAGMAAEELTDQLYAVIRRITALREVSNERANEAKLTAVQAADFAAQSYSVLADSGSANMLARSAATFKADIEQRDFTVTSDTVLDAAIGALNAAVEAVTRLNARADPAIVAAQEVRARASQHIQLGEQYLANL